MVDHDHRYPPFVDGRQRRSSRWLTMTTVIHRLLTAAHRYPPFIDDRHRYPPFVDGTPTPIQPMADHDHRYPPFVDGSLSWSIRSGIAAGAHDERWPRAV
jgi:hypothetical protein